jgi:hypothetical protein
MVEELNPLIGPNPRNLYGLAREGRALGIVCEHDPFADLRRTASTGAPA